MLVLFFLAVDFSTLTHTQTVETFPPCTTIALSPAQFFPLNNSHDKNTSLCLALCVNPSVGSERLPWVVPVRSSPAWPVLHWPRPRCCCFCCSPAVCHARVLCQMVGAIRACQNAHTRAHADHSRGEETRSNLRNVVDVVVVVGALLLLKIPLSTRTHTLTHSHHTRSQ